MSASARTTRRGPRLIVMERQPDGFGFHMYTNKVLHGQYVKVVTEGGVAYQAGMQAGDHIIEVNGTNVEKETHAEVVSRVRLGEKAVLLVIDEETEALFKRQGKTVADGSYIEVTIPSVAEVGPRGEEPPLGNMADAWPKGKKRVKTGDWATKTAMFNEL